jgi:cell wall-associated NlpC family hydrolase
VLVLVQRFRLREFIGIPYRPGGRDFQGCDCWGLVRLFYLGLDIELPDQVISPQDLSGIDQAVREDMPRWIKVSAEEVPSVALFCLSKSGLIDHMGVNIGGSRMLHTIAGKSAHLVRLDHPFYRARRIGFYQPCICGTGILPVIHGRDARAT